MGNRSRDAEAELNLPPGFRFHPTDEELVVHYLCRKVTYQTLPVPIIAEIDLYKFDPWKLPDMALFGQKEWYFFTPRDRKYPNGSRPNRSAGSGYWKATGADKPIRPAGSSRLAGIKKALVFYAGKAPKGVKTNWIMHEYRLADPNRPTNKRGSLRLDDWVLCRIYNKKNSNEKVVVKQTEEEESVDSFDTFQYRGSERTPESEVEDLSIESHDHHATYGAEDVAASQVLDHGLMQTRESLKEDNEWFKDLNLDDLYNNRAAFDITSTPNFMYPDYDYQGVPYPQLKPSFPNMLPY